MTATVSAWLLLRLACGAIALPLGLATASLLWTGQRAVRAVTCSALLAAVAGARLLPFGAPRDIAYATAIIALPALAALRRSLPALLAEAALAGAGPIRRSAIGAKLAAPGLGLGFAVWLAAPTLGLPAVLFAAALPLGLMPAHHGR